ncbi:dihydrolipoyl dehydrogenase [Sporolactobacillus terrae]|uniref:Dihydrolipoyl dehydrogenase n=1 Tax=Sporolactobacillus terrae TaxID=269673 RepID=A0ABX5Q6F6_9BACL|nr:dihydrolipoyl dehydrogenase [Sporolactobacillus terrae]QAA22228.1 dihydrolipoyl dehydrogenase [Sporolactobacillus terrae]QAA25202.1 dihydrolipoyl dehydrogenase [Sporolactobacillus terrae]UAK17019.1 dihydrolipoyl dehydrogenase [Sporolactobacillus terrae]
MVVGEFTTEVDTVVIGAGPGGYVAAIRAAQLGQKVIVIEKQHVGGVCLNVGCIPSKALISASHRFEQMNHSESMGISAENVHVDFHKVQEWKGQIVDRLTSGVKGLFKAHNIESVEGEALFVDSDVVRVNHGYESSRYKFNHCIIATGSSPIEIPGFKWSSRVLSSTGALALKEIPKKLVVIGGGYIGIELSSALAGFGTEVVILEGSPSILPAFEKRLIAPVKKKLKAKGVSVFTKALAKGVEETANGVSVTAEVKGKTQTFDADYVMVTVGRRPNTKDLGLDLAGVELGERGLIHVDKQGKTSNDKVYAIGDIVSGMALAHKASYEGKIAAEAISGIASEVDYRAMPAVVFSDPEIASVGLSEEEAVKEGYEVKTGQFPFAANGRALSLGESDGFLKIVSRASDGLVLGAQIVGVSASDMIAEFGLAVESGMTVEDLALTIHAHPTLGEIAMEAADVVLGHPIHIAK